MPCDSTMYNLYGFRTTNMRPSYIYLAVIGVQVISGCLVMWPKFNQERHKRQRHARKEEKAAPSSFRYDAAEVPESELHAERRSTLIAYTTALMLVVGLMGYIRFYDLQDILSVEVFTLYISMAWTMGFAAVGRYHVPQDARNIMRRHWVNVGAGMVLVFAGPVLFTLAKQRERSEW